MVDMKNMFSFQSKLAAKVQTNFRATFYRAFWAKTCPVIDASTTLSLNDIFCSLV